MRAALVIAALLCAPCAAAQTTPPSANDVAAVEAALHCEAILERAEEGLRTASLSGREAELENLRLEPIRLRYVRSLTANAMRAGYSAELLTARKAAHRQRVAAYLDWQHRENIGSCAFGEAPPPDMSFGEPPKAKLAFAMAGKGANDVLYVDMGSLYRHGPNVIGWQLYVFKADKGVAGKVAKAQWVHFRADCARALIATYGPIEVGDLRAGAPMIVDNRKAGTVQAVAPNTFGAATWMLACEVRMPGATLPGLAAAADDTARQFGTQQ